MRLDLVDVIAVRQGWHKQIDGSSHAVWFKQYSMILKNRFGDGIKKDEL